MKKICSILATVALMAQMIIPSFAEGQPYSETGYVFDTVYTLKNTNGNPTTVEEIQNTLGRTFGVTTYEAGGKTFACLGQQYGLKVYDITDPTDWKLVQDGNYIKSITQKTDAAGKVTTTITPLFQNDGQYPIRTYKGNVYFSSGTGSTYVFPINSDGTLDMPVKKNENDAYYTLSGYNRNSVRAIYGMDFIDDHMITLSNTGSTWIAEQIVVFDVSLGKLPTPVSYPTNGYAFAVRSMKLNSGAYRICYISSTEKTSNTGNSIFNIVDYDPEQQTFTEVYSGIPEDENWPDIPAYFKPSQPVFLSENCVALAWGKDPSSTTTDIRKTLAVDFSDTTAPQVEVIGTTNASADENRASWLTAYDGNLISWNTSTNIYDLSSPEHKILGNYLPMQKARLCDVTCIGNQALLALDDRIVLVQIEKQTSTEEALPSYNRVLNVGTVNTCSIKPDESTSIKPIGMATAEFGGKTIAYIKDGNTGKLFTYDVTDPQNMQFLKEYDYNFKTYGQALAIKENYLFVANNATVAVIPIQADGSLSDSVLMTFSAGNNQITKMEIKDNLLFTLSYGHRARAYDISNIAGGSAPLLYTFSEAARGMAVEQLSNLRYRVYIAQTETLDSGSKTAQLIIYELLQTLQGLKTEVKFEAGIPDLSAVNVWPGKGIYGEDSSVDGYIGFSSTDSCTLHPLGNGKLRYAVDTLSGDMAGHDDIIIDVSDPTAPKVTAHIPKINTEWTPRQYTIDSKQILEQNQIGKNAYITEYSADSRPEKKYVIPDFNGTALSVTGNIAYAAAENTLKAVQLYENNQTLAISDVVVTDQQGNTVTTVEKGILTASVSINNQTDTPLDACMMIAMYDKLTDNMEYVQLERKQITGYDTIASTIDLFQLSDYSAYAKYIKIFLWDANMQPLTEAKKISALEAEGTDFEIWLPEDTQVIKGMMIMHQHGMAGSLRNLPAFKEQLSELGMGCMTIIEPSTGTLKAFADPDLCGGYVLNALSNFAKTTGHPELVNVPIATLGHSNGNKFGAGLAAWMPERVIATIVYKPGFAGQFELDTLTDVPVLLIEGELDTAYGCGTHGLFEAAQRMREKGALLHYIMDPDAGHGSNAWKSNSILFPFLKTAFELRVPADANPLDGVVTLNKIDKTSGYIGTIKTTVLDSTINADNNKVIQDRTFSGTYKLYAEAYPSPNTPVTDGVWLPTEEYARQWAEFLENGVVSGITYQ